MFDDYVNNYLYFHIFISVIFFERFPTQKLLRCLRQRDQKRLVEYGLYTITT